MKSDVFVSLVINYKSNTLLLKDSSKLFGLPRCQVKEWESPSDSALRLLNGLKAKGEIVGLLGVYILFDKDRSANEITFGFKVNLKKDMSLSVGKFYSKSDIDKLIEEEKYLKDPSITSALLRDFLQGKLYSKDLIKIVESPKL
jgi:hypothetical protein